MAETDPSTIRQKIAPVAVISALVFLYYSVASKLVLDWWSDENYSHGLLVPFVIGFIVWNERDRFVDLIRNGAPLIGSAVVAIAFALLAAGTLGAELFTQRVSLVLMLVGIVVYFSGTRIVSMLAVPVALLLLSIPIPQILFNRIAFPLQIWASKMAVWGIRLFDVPVVRKGNVIDILPGGSTQTISLEVVEACSGIRSLMTLVTLSLILAYFTRNFRGRTFGGFSKSDLLRTVLLMITAVPIAVMTNAARVTATGVFTYYYGKQATEATLHDASGWLVYLVALVLLIGTNIALKKILPGKGEKQGPEKDSKPPAGKLAGVLPLVVAMIVGGAAVNWFVSRGEADVQRKPLTELSRTLGEWNQKGEEIKFGPDTESVLRTTDYTMREYTLPDGRVANIYIGYYASQRTGATYHSPQNCLPGAGWVMSDPQTVDIETNDGRSFKANRYTVKNGVYKEVMIYWYQGRGRTEASEYTDKLNTIWDSVTRRRTDGAMIRVMTSVGGDEDAAVKAAVDLSKHLTESLDAYLPE